MQHYLDKLVQRMNNKKTTVLSQRTNNNDEPKKYGEIITWANNNQTKF